MDTQAPFFLLAGLSLFVGFMSMGYMIIMNKKLKENDCRIDKLQFKKQSTEKQSEPKQDDLEKVLNKLFTNSIITQQQYNQLLVKGLPYFK